MPSPYYPDDILPWQVCIIEGHDGPNCRSCGHVDYAWLGWTGAVAAFAKRHDLTRDEAEAEMELRTVCRELREHVRLDGEALSEQGLTDFREMWIKWDNRIYSLFESLPEVAA